MQELAPFVRNESAIVSVAALKSYKCIIYFSKLLLPFRSVCVFQGVCVGGSFLNTADYRYSPAES